jgi:hypothetical protein
MTDGGQSNVCYSSFSQSPPPPLILIHLIPLPILLPLSATILPGCTEYCQGLGGAIMSDFMSVFLSVYL